jgi:hypothetical protein
MNPAELIVRRRLVLAFIRADPISVQFSRRPARLKTESGGWVKSSAPPTSIPRQIVRIIPSKRRFDNGLVNAEAGEIPRSEYLLLGPHTLDVTVDDEFQWGDNHYKVSGIFPSREERTLCSVDALGPSNG